VEMEAEVETAAEAVGAVEEDTVDAEKGSTETPALDAVHAESGSTGTVKVGIPKLALADLDKAAAKVAAKKVRADEVQEAVSRGSAKAASRRREESRRARLESGHPAEPTEKTELDLGHILAPGLGLGPDLFAAPAGAGANGSVFQRRSASQRTTAGTCRSVDSPQSVFRQRRWPVKQTLIPR